MPRSRSRSPRRGGGDDRRIRDRPADYGPSSVRDYDREKGDDRRSIDYRGGYSRDEGRGGDDRGGRGGYRDERRDRDDRGGSDRHRKKDRSRSRDRDDRKRSRSRSRGRDGRSAPKKPVQLDEFGRVIDADRKRSVSPDRPRRFNPRMRSESPDREEQERLKKEKEKEEKSKPMWEVNEDDDPETAEAKMEMQMMAQMGIPVDFDTTKGKGGKQTDAAAVSGGVRIKPQREHRQYMNRRCGFNKPLPAEATKTKFGIGTSSSAPRNTHW